MGGGAGINWGLELESFPLKLNKAGELVPGRKVEIAEWSASDYLNAMDNIRPDLLRILSINSTRSISVQPRAGSYDTTSSANCRP